VVHLGPPAIRLQPSMRFTPVRRLIGLLLPMDQRCFVTPLQQSSHHLPMRSGAHKSFHGGFCCPDGASPVRVAGVTK
jgi:hypothetical protein